ncbi:MAG: methylenetetrahydrofolate reductase [Bacteroidia bacterium]|nr:methylenetetrahydrofolate reductase [Bacteroidia bacterium]MDW8333017.1 methylenetetrahydrofolate reductase [Bacteroidia bacterium]
MKVIEHIERADKPIISIEIIPPRRGGSFELIDRAIASILPFKPSFIDVTSHSAEVVWDEQPDGTYKRVVKRKSPGTFGICAAIKYKYDIDPVPHILCSGFTREETEDALIELNYLGVENLLLIRGDSKYDKPVAEGKSVNQYALNLVEQVTAMNRGCYLDKLMDAAATDFCIGVAAYPEKHFQSPNLKFDIEILKKKQDAGAHYAITQMFFDNRRYFDFVEKCREAGITIPIIPGLKIITLKKHLQSLPAAFHVSFPEDFVDDIVNAKNDAQVREIGLDFALKQALDLLDKGVKHLHYYVMLNANPFIELMQRLKKKI